MADFHTAFNLVLALVFFPLLGPDAQLLERWMPVRVDAPDPGQPFMTTDERAARLLATEKEVFRGMETIATDAHFERLRAAGSTRRRPVRCTWTRYAT